MALAQTLKNKWLVRLYALIVFLVAWQIIGNTVNPIIFAPPSDVATLFVQLWNSYLFPDTILTIQVVLVGFAFAMVAGIPIGIAMGSSRRVEFGVDPYVNLLYATPIIVIIPLITIWYNSSFSSNYIVEFFAAVLPIIINTTSGVKNVSRNILETGHSFGFEGLSVWRKITLPASTPYIMSGLRIGIGHAVIGAILAEMFLYPGGLGYAIVNYSSFFDTAAVISAVLLTVALGVILTEIVKVAERRISSWSLSV